MSESSDRIATMLDEAERVLRESGSNEGIRADEIVRRMLANGSSVIDLKPNSLYSAIGADIRDRERRRAPQRFDRPGQGIRPSLWTISLASAVAPSEHAGPAEAPQRSASPLQQPALPPSSTRGEPVWESVGDDSVNHSASVPPSPATTRQRAASSAAAGAHGKDKTAAALLCIFLGGVGAHRFYVGKSRSGLAQAVLVGGGLILDSIRGTGAIGDIGTVAALGAALWVVVDLITILRGRFTDASGIRLGSAGSTTAEPAVQDVAASRRIEHSILRAVESLGGLVGPTELALQTGLTIDDAKEHLESLVERGHAQLEIRKNGSLAYTFPDLLSTEKRDELEEL